MKYFNVLLLTTAFSINASIAGMNGDSSEIKGDTVRQYGQSAGRATADAAETLLGLKNGNGKRVSFANTPSDNGPSDHQPSKRSKANASTNPVGQNTALSLFELGNDHLKQNNFTGAVTQYNAALTMPECIGELRAMCLTNLGKTYFSQKNFTGAITLYNAALNIVVTR